MQKVHFILCVYQRLYKLVSAYCVCIRKPQYRVHVHDMLADYKTPENSKLSVLE